MKSMTGFAQATAEGEGRRIEVTVQGWNQRHLDAVLRLPEDLRGREPALRQRLGAAVQRGRCEVVVRSVSTGLPATRVRIDAAAVAALQAGAGDLVRDGLVDPRLTLGELLRAPGLVVVESGELAWTEADSARLDAAFDQALVDFAMARAAEGGRLAAALERARGELASLTVALTARRGTAAARLGESLRARLAELLDPAGSPVPEERLAQEIALLVDKGDIREELDRLAAHLDHFAEIATRDEAVGKRLEFLTQEILRELNTIGSKSRDVEMTRLVVDAKVICEQIREQLQNVE
ncbi:MAG: YicC family protein [Thermoanaerobaculia bacterium]|nr:MAG: YicC family protein [Thermoanaerobaculia bacterium]MBZ0103525.1 YicC family protein [Thermoanaerobaculia bacterium]